MTKQKETPMRVPLGRSAPNRKKIKFLKVTVKETVIFLLAGSGV